MRTSDSIVKLAAALVAAQAEMKNAPKETKGQVGNQTRYYTDLPTLTDLVRPILAKHKLAYVQLPSSGGNGFVELTTRILHESGEWLEADYPMPAGNGAQGVGSALTYARRYALMAALGIAADDDDGAAATAPHTAPAAVRQPGPDALATEPQLKKLAIELTKLGITADVDRHLHVARLIGRPDLTSFKELTRSEASDAINHLIAGVA